MRKGSPRGAVVWALGTRSLEELGLEDQSVSSLL